MERGVSLERRGDQGIKMGEKWVGGRCEVTAGIPAAEGSEYRWLRGERRAERQPVCVYLCARMCVWMCLRKRELVLADLESVYCFGGNRGCAKAGRRYPRAVLLWGHERARVRMDQSSERFSEPGLNHVPWGPLGADPWILEPTMGPSAIAEVAL